MSGSWDNLVLECSMAERHGALAGLATTGTHSAEEARNADEDRPPDLVIDSLYELIGRLEAAPVLAGKEGS